MQSQKKDRITVRVGLREAHTAHYTFSRLGEDGTPEGQFLSFFFVIPARVFSSQKNEEKMVTNECAKRKKITRGLACKLIATFNFFFLKAKARTIFP